MDKVTFTIYQARNGLVYLANGNAKAVLTQKQILDLYINIFALDEFDFDSYKMAYDGDAQSKVMGMKIKA